MGTLTICTLNINGLSEPKLDSVLLHMRQQSISVYILIDTRLSPKNTHYLSKRARSTLGPGTRVHTAKLNAFVANSKNATHRVGGIMFIVAPAWGPSLLSCQDDHSQTGALSSITLQTTKGRICVAGTYWPIHHTMSADTLDDQNLWARISAYLHNHKHRETPIDYLQRLALTWFNTAMKGGAHACILAGDLNSTWTPDEPGGQRSISKWATDNSLCNGPLLIANHLDTRHITRPSSKDGLKPSTWIDHILHIGEIHHIDPIASYTSTGAEWMDVSDHRPLWTVYTTGKPTTPLPQSALKAKPRVDLDASDKRVTEDFTEAMRKYALHRPPDLTSPESAARSLLGLQAISPIITAQLNSKYGKGLPRSDMKDGWSPSYMVLKLYLITVIEIRRKLTGAKQRRRWTTHLHATTGIQWLILELQAHIRRLDIPQPDVDNLIHLTGCDLHWWTQLDRMPTVLDCDPLIHTLRKDMQGRLRTDFRTNMNAKIAHREHMRQIGKMKTVLRSILGVLGGRKHVETLNLDVIKNSSGDIAVTPDDVHSMVTDHFREWFSAPTTRTTRLHTHDDWHSALTSLEIFQQTIAHTNTPPWASAIIFDAMTNNPDRDDTAAELDLLLATPPSYADFTYAIKHLHNGSAPGISGLSYNMVKAWPDNCKQMAYDCLARQWEDKYTCPSWKWRWLVPIPKKQNDLTMLNDLRPLMLIEVLRKIWTSLVVSKLQSVWRRRGTLNPAQHGCQSLMGTATASILHIDSIEAAHEANVHLHRSSWDKSRAFDSVSKNLMRLAWHRHGVPQSIIDYLVEMDIDGPTIVRTPKAAKTWEERPYACVDSPHQPFDIDDPVTQLLDSFTADRGTGQGDVSSPASWNAVFDILLTALQRDEISQTSTRQLQAADQTMYTSTETAYVDDLVSCCLTPEQIQRKADIVSAFCLITGITISIDKLRRVVHTWSRRPLTDTPVMYIHEYGWIPRAIPVTTDGSTSYLGVAYDASYSGKTALQTLLSISTQTCNTIVHTRASDTTKLETVICSPYAKARYIGKLSNLTLSQLRRVDKVFNKFLTTTTKNMHGFPAELLHLSWKYGGLGLPRFSDTVQLDKYQILLSALQSTSPQHHAAQSHLHRAVRMTQGDLLPGQGVTILPHSHKQRHRWLDSLTQWLSEAGIYISRHGARKTDLKGDQPIYDYLPHTAEYTPLRLLLKQYGLNVLDDINATDATAWTLPDPLEAIRQLLPLHQPLPASHQPALRIGQYWQFPRSHTTGRTTIYEIVSWNDPLIAVYKWTRERSEKPQTYIRANCTTTLMYDDLFPTDALHTRITMLHGPNAVIGKSCLPRTQASPQTDPIAPLPTPQWLTWLRDRTTSTPDYMPAIYTDGSHLTSHSINSILQPTTAIVTASAAIVIKDNSPNWKSKPIYVVRVTEGDSIGAASAYTMEFLSLAMAMTVGTNLSLKPVMSDAESIIKMIPHRKEELRNTHKTHHTLLTAIDLLIASGSPTPQHIRSHPEKHKPDRNSWTCDDWGNYIADRAAGNDLTTLRRAGLDIHDSTVQSATALSHLLTPGHWYLSDIAGIPISTIGLRELMQQFHFRQYITTRDGYRSARGDSIKWAHNTIEFATQAFSLQHRTTAQRAVEVRRL